MQKQQKKLIGIVCLVVCAICVAVGVERYSANARNVRAINAMQQSSPFGGMMNGMTGGAELKPATPAATKYALVGAVLAGIGGVVLLTQGAKRQA